MKRNKRNKSLGAYTKLIEKEEDPPVRGYGPCDMKMARLY